MRITIGEKCTAAMADEKRDDIHLSLEKFGLLFSLRSNCDLSSAEIIGSSFFSPLSSSGSPIFSF